MVSPHSFTGLFRPLTVGLYLYALVMGAISNRYGANEAAVLAVAAGADIVLMPLDPEGAIQAVSQAVEEERIPADQIRSSVERIWQAKQRVCAPKPPG